MSGGFVMDCPQCGKSNLSVAVFCAACGAKLSGAGSGVGIGAGAGGGALSAVAGDMAKRTTSLKASLKRQTRALKRGASGPRPALPGTPQKPGVASLNPEDLHPWDALNLVFPLPRTDLLDQSAQFVFSSPHIVNNQFYAQRMRDTTFFISEEDLTMNAYATDHPYEGEDGHSIDPPVIVFLLGMEWAIRVTATALAAHMCQPNHRSIEATGLRNAMWWIGQTIVENGGAFTLLAEGEPMDETASVDVLVPMIEHASDRVPALAQSYAAAMEMYILAHEAGHICLGHTLGINLSYEVSRNQEREADSFAASALVSSPFRDYLFLGHVFATLLMVWANHAGGGDQADPTTHPRGVERFQDAIRSHAQAAREAEAEFGLSQAELEKLLPSA